LVRKHERKRTLGSGQGPVAGSCEHGNEPSDSIKCSKFFDYLSNYISFSKITLFHGGSSRDKRVDN
jgi:hypothetical protein